MRRFALILFLLAVAGSAGYGVLWWKRQAAARSLDRVIAEPPPPQPRVAEEPRPIDARLSGLPDRGDGARLAFAPPTGMTVLRAAFIDNTTLVVTATTTDPAAPYRLFAYDLRSRSATGTDLRGTAPRLASGHRPAHRNADAFCYASPNESGRFEAWCSDFTGKKHRRLTTHDGREDLIDPSVSPDGGWLLFEANADRAGKDGGASAVWKIHLNGSGLSQLTRGADDRFPAWSSDGKKVFFQRRLPEGSWDAYVMDADGKDPAPLLRTPDEDELWPVPLPGSASIVMSVASSSASPRLRRLDLETKKGEWLTSGAGGPETHPSVSLDGALAAFLAPIDAAAPSALGVWLVPVGP